MKMQADLNKLLDARLDQFTATLQSTFNLQSSTPPPPLLQSLLHRSPLFLPNLTAYLSRDHDGPLHLTLHVYDHAHHVLHTVTHGFVTNIPDNLAYPAIPLLPTNHHLAIEDPLLTIRNPAALPVLPRRSPSPWPFTSTSYIGNLVEIVRHLRTLCIAYTAAPDRLAKPR